MPPSGVCMILVDYQFDQQSQDANGETEEQKQEGPLQVMHGEGFVFVVSFRSWSVVVGTESRADPVLDDSGLVEPVDQMVDGPLERRTGR